MTRSVDVIAAARQHPGMAALIRAIELHGSIPSLATAIGTGPGKVRRWLTSSYEVPLEFVPLIVAAANDPQVTPRSLRPDYEHGWKLLARQLRIHRSTIAQPVDEPDPEPEALTE